MGKRTTTRHKENNTFRFESFGDKLKGISVNVNLSIRDGRSELPEGEDTFFNQEIEKWLDLNRTESFGHLLSQIGEDVKSLPQLILQKDRLVSVLLQHLKDDENSPSFEPTFALVVALARDLGAEFYPHFIKFFKRIVDIVIRLKKPDVIEHGFRAYAYLAKYLRRQIIRDLPLHLTAFAPLLHPKLKNYVVIFACEAFEVVVSKYAKDNPEKFLHLVFNILLKDNPENSVGLATLLFSIFKGVNRSLKVNGPGLKLETCIDHTFSLDHPDRPAWTAVLKVLLQKLATYGKESDLQVLFECVENMLVDPKGREHAGYILTLYRVLLEVDGSAKISNLGRTLSALKIAMEACVEDEEHFRNLYETLLFLVEMRGKKGHPEVLTGLRPALLKILQVGDEECVTKVDSALQDTTHYFHSYLPPIAQAYNRLQGGKDENETILKNTAVRCISSAILRQNGFYHLAKKREESHLFSGFGLPLTFYGEQRKLIRPLNLVGILNQDLYSCCELTEEAKKSLSPSSSVQASIDDLSRLLMTVSRISLGECKACQERYKEIANLLIETLKICEDKQKSVFSSLLYFTLEAVIMHGPAEASLLSLDGVRLTDLLEGLRGVVSEASNGSAEFSLWSLKCLDLLVHYTKLSHPAQQEILLPLLIETGKAISSNLMSGFKIVRTLTLSVLLNLEEISPRGEKVKGMLEKFMEIENSSILNPKFSPLVKSVLTEGKVLMESGKGDEVTRKLCLQYGLGLLYSNFNLIWSTCIELVNLAGKHLQMSEFWGIFGPHFFSHFPSEGGRNPQLTLFREVEDYPRKLEELAFGFSGGTVGLQEAIDVAQYRVNLWKCLISLPLGKGEYQELKPVIDRTITNTFPESLTQRGFSGEIQKTLVPFFQFLEKCDHTSSDLSLWEKGLDHLTSAPEVQKAAWEFLHAKRRNKLKGFKEDVDELVKSESMDPYHKFRMDAIDTSQNQQYSSESKEKRRLLMDIVIRILIGKERRWKAEKRLQSLRFIAGCTADDAKTYLELTVGSGLKDQKISPKAIEVKINKVANCIRAWRYKFPSIMDELLSLVCDLIQAIPDLKKPFPKYADEEELPQEVFEEQKRGALKAGRLCLLAFFTFLPKFNLEKETLNRLFQVFIWEGIEELRNHTGSNISWIMKLLSVWAQRPRFHALFAKCREGEETSSAMSAIFHLLAKKGVHFEVQKHIISLLLNLSNPEDSKEEVVGDADPSSFSLDQAEKFDGRTLTVDGLFVFPDSDLELGLRILLHGKRVILGLFEDAQVFRRLLGSPGGEGCLALVDKLADFVDDEERDLVAKLASILIDTLPLYKRNEENLCNCIRACKRLLEKVADPETLLLKLAPVLIWLQGRRLRSAAADLLCSGQDKLPFLRWIGGMNAWAEDAVDTPDFSRRQEAFQGLESHMSKEPFNLLLYTLATANAFHFVLHDADIGMRNSSKALLIFIAEKLGSKLRPSTTLPIKTFMEASILPRLRGGLCHKDESRFADFLQIFLGFVSNCGGVHGTFRELEKLISPDIVEGLYDIQVHLRTRAMNKLCTKISENGKDVSPTVLKNLILPIPQHNLLDEEKLGQSRTDLIHSSIETLKEILLLLPQQHYFKFLGQLVNTSKKKTRLAKQYERILIATMDAYHFDLSLALSDGAAPLEETKKEEKPETRPAEDDQEKTDQAEAEPSEDEESEVEDEPDPDKNSAPTTSPSSQLLSKAAATKCLRLLKTVIIPKLREYLNFEEKATHKLSRAEKSVDDDVILKIPCTLALVKLLKRLPKSEGQTSIRAVIPNLVAGLRNELYSTRHSLRKTILSVLRELGLEHFRTVVSYLKATLQRGYQKHVLNFTVSYFMKCLEPELRAAPSLLPIREILPLCQDELYGVMQEEKELAKIKSKTREAGKSNAIPILKLCGKCVAGKEQLWALIAPPLQQLQGKRSARVVKTTRQWLLAVAEGITDNVSGMEGDELVEWLLAVLEKEQKEEGKEKGEEEPEKKKRKLLEETKDPLLIPVLNRKTTGDGKGVEKGQLLLTEFAFTTLYLGLNKSTRLRDSLLRKGRIGAMDPFVPLLGEGIKANSKQVTIVSLRTLTLLFEFELTSFTNEELVDSVRRSGFISMNNHCYRSSGDSQMSNATFKFLTAFFTRFPDYKIQVADFELMLKCVQGYLTSEEVSSAALTLLKGVLRNKYSSPLLQPLMEEVFRQGIQSLYQHVNEGCRGAYLLYLLNYCTAPKHIIAQVRLILNQFEYEMENGRLTAVEIMSSLLENLPEKCLEEVKELVFLKTLTCLDKEGGKKVRAGLASVIKTLFKNEGEKKSLARLLLKLISSNNHNSELDTLFLIAGVLIDDPSIFTGSDLAQLLDKTDEVVDPEKFQTLCLSSSHPPSQQAQDYAVFQALNCLKKGLDRKVGEVHFWEKGSPLQATMEGILETLVEKSLLYEHVWVPPLAVDILFQVLGKTELSSPEVQDKVAASLEIGKGSHPILKNSERLRTFAKNLWNFLKFCQDEVQEEVVMKATLSFVQLSCVAARLKETELFKEIVDEVRKSVNHEVVRDPKNTKMRSLAFASFRGIVSGSPSEAVSLIAEGLTRTAVRELTDDGIPTELKMEAEKLTSVLRSALGAVDFNGLYAKMNDFFHKKRNLNRAKKKETLVLHPGLVRKRAKKTGEPKMPFKKAKFKKNKA